MNAARAATIIRAHGIDAWPTDDPATVLAMDVTVETRPSGPIVRAEPVLIDVIDLEGWLGY